MAAGLGGQLGQGAVVVQTGHGREARGGDVGGVGRGDESVGVGGVAHDEHLDVIGCAGVERLTLGTEDAAVGGEQVSALHAGLAGHGTHEEGNVGALEGSLGVVEDVDAAQGREGGVEQLHGGALSSLDRRRDLQEAEVDALVRTEQGTGGDAEQQRVADVAGRTSDGDVDGGVCHRGLLRDVCRRGPQAAARQDNAMTSAQVNTPVHHIS